jgi:hypothetical protein
MKMVTTDTSGTPHVIPMPRWSSIVGIARLVLAVLVLAFVAAAAGLWGDASYAAFGLTLFTVRKFEQATLRICLTRDLANRLANTGIGDAVGLCLLHPIALSLATSLFRLGRARPRDLWRHFLAHIVRALRRMDCHLQPFLVDAWE